MQRQYSIFCNILIRNSFNILIHDSLSFRSELSVKLLKLQKQLILANILIFIKNKIIKNDFKIWKQNESLVISIFHKILSAICNVYVKNWYYCNFNSNDCLCQGNSWNAPPTDIQIYMQYICTLHTHSFILFMDDSVFRRNMPQK